MLKKSEARKIVKFLGRIERGEGALSDLAPMEPIFKAHGIGLPATAVELTCLRMAFEIAYKL